LHQGGSLLQQIKKKKKKQKDSDFFDEPTANGWSLWINDPSNKQKQSLYSKCAKRNGDAKCFESISQCCCFYKPKE
jgi:hypothetical protein